MLFMSFMVNPAPIYGIIPFAHTRVLDTGSRRIMGLGCLLSVLLSLRCPFSFWRDVREIGSTGW